MAAGFRLCSKVCVQAAFDHGHRLQVTAEGQAVGVVVAAAVLRDMLAPGHHATYARHLVGGNGDAGAAATDHDGKHVVSVGGQRRAGQAGKFRVVGALGAGAAVVGAGVTEPRQVLDEFVLESVSAMVAAEVDVHACLPMVAAASILPTNITISALINRR